MQLVSKDSRLTCCVPSDTFGSMAMLGSETSNHNKLRYFTHVDFVAMTVAGLMDAIVIKIFLKCN